MGMAASQARYLSLSARKTNTEYEGQQLNQQRLNLANQSADLFNQMLTMSVPTCPDSNDFTTLQYSWSDGINDEVISDFYQISIPNEDYNYVVTSYHYENVYTGQSKRMNAPEIQATKTNHFVDNPDKTYEVRQMAYHAESLPGAGDDSYTLLVTKNGVESNHVFRRVDTTMDSVEEIDAITKRTTKAIAGDKANFVPGNRVGTNGANIVVTPAKWGFDSQYKVTVRVPNSAYDSKKQMSQDNMPFSYVDGIIPTAYKLDERGITTWDPNQAGFTQVDFNDETQRPIIEQLLASYGDKYDASKTYFAAALQKAKTTTGTLDGTAVIFNQAQKIEDDRQKVKLANGVETNLQVFTDGADTPKKYFYLNGQYYDCTAGGTFDFTLDTPPEAADLTQAQIDGLTVSQTKTDLYEYEGKYYTSPTAVSTGTGANEYVPTTTDVIENLTDGYIVDAAGNKMYAFVCGDDMDAASGSQGEVAKIEIRGGDKTAYYTDGTYVLSGEELSAIDLTAVDQAAWLDDIIFHSVDNAPQYTNFDAVGNCKLNEVSLKQYAENEDMSIEIQQVIKDMKDGGNSVAYGNLSACFDPTTGEYIGGIYSFKMFGHTYYTTVSDLETAVQGAWREEATATNGIDSQNKLCYYTSTYINTKIEDTKKALMETDGKGRFSTVKFEDDDTVYSLKCETITDDAAYQNAMNQYFYKQEQYDKAVADINAKTEIIQAEDRELQLRLEQLGTEQTALQTEMEACQKVVSKNIEGSFKTFGG